MSVTVSNPTSNLSGKELVITTGTHTITGPFTFDRDPSSPFLVTSGSAKVDNLDADKLDGQEGADFLLKAGGTVVGTVLFSPDNSFDIGDATHRVRAVYTASLQLSGGQVAFPAAQNPSTDVNTLDDYEEGVWTPVLGGSGGTSGQTYTTQVGKYVKIGKLVHAYGQIVLSNKGTITTLCQIQGLPFTSENTTGLNAPLVVSYFANMGSNWCSLGGQVLPNTTVSSLTGVSTAAAANHASSTTADITNTTTLVFSITYAATA